MDDQKKYPEVSSSEQPAPGSQPFYSIVTVVLNDAAGFRKTASSIVSQTSRDYEWVVIDGASSDGTLEGIDRDDVPHLTLLSERDKGLYDAMNKGLIRSRGKYLVFLNAGDIFNDPDVLRDVTEAIARASEADLVYGDAVEDSLSGESHFKKARSIEWIKYGMFTHHQAIFYRASATEARQYNSSLKVAGDYDFTCRTFMNTRSGLQLNRTICRFARGGISEKAAHIGRQENWTIQRDALKLSFVERAAIRSLYMGSYLVRTHLRGLYDKLRFRRVANEG